MKKFILTLMIILVLSITILAIPTKNELETMDYAFQGQPFIDIPVKDSIDLTTMDYAYQGQPFVRVISTEVEGWAHKWNTQTISKWNTKELTKWNDLE